MTSEPDETPETVVFKGQRWTVAVAQWDEVESGTGSHWHLTLTNPQPLESRTPTRERPRRERAVTSGIQWQSEAAVPGARLSPQTQAELQEKLRQIDEAQARGMASARNYVIYR